MEKIEKLSESYEINSNGDCVGYRYPDNYEIMNKVNELIEKMNEIIEGGITNG